jgi:hypothetical protein
MFGARKPEAGPPGGDQLSASPTWRYAVPASSRTRLFRAGAAFKPPQDFSTRACRPTPAGIEPRPSSDEHARGRPDRGASLAFPNAREQRESPLASPRAPRFRR